MLDSIFDRVHTLRSQLSRVSREQGVGTMVESTFAHFFHIRG